MIDEVAAAVEANVRSSGEDGHLLVLTSVAPDYHHFRAAGTVVAVLAEELAKRWAKVTVALVGAVREIDVVSAKRLRDAGVEVIRLRCEVVPMGAHGQGRMAELSWLLRVSLPWAGALDEPRLRDPARLARQIDDVGADAALLFWDSIAEFAAPGIRTPLFGYLARPPLASTISRATSNTPSPGRALSLAAYRAQMRRHFLRARTLAGSLNICAMDAADYRRAGVDCSYVPNTWPDPVGDEWRQRRREAESRRDGVHVLGNIGALNGTGNIYGMRYLAREVLPRLERRRMAAPWTVNICGRFDLPADLVEDLRSPRVALRGFVEDIDDEVAGNHVFAVMNNAGPYTGGYTRVIYAFATGACLVAHAKLADSMPELVDGRNCLLGRTPDDIADRLAVAVDDPELRARIGAAARATYEHNYRPSRVAESITRHCATVVNRT